MPKKLTYEQVKYFIEIESNSGYKLISTEYKNAKTKLIIQCINGHIYEMCFDKFKQGRRCPICPPIIKYTYNEVKEIIESEKGYSLISDIYINTKTKLIIKCDKGHEYKVKFNSFLEGHRCPICNTGGNHKYDLEKVKDIFEEQNCKLLSSEYLNSSQILDYICSCGNVSKISLSTFLQGHRCLECRQEKSEITNLKKYGVKHSSQNKEVKLKQIQSMYKYGTAPCSLQQKYICNLTGGDLNYPVSNCFLDIAFVDEKIYIEYDGGLHDGKVKFRKITQEQFNTLEKNRELFLFRKGWKIIRIISKKDNLPSDIVIKHMIDFSKDYLNSGHHWIKLDIDNSIVINANGEFKYNFEQLRKIKKEDIKGAL